MLRAAYQKYALTFKTPSGTSRGIMHSKISWFLFLWDDQSPAIQGIGECGPLPGLSLDDRPDFEEKLASICAQPDAWIGKELADFPSIQCGLEMALMDLKKRGSKILFDTPFTSAGAPINMNGLIWMGEPEFMEKQIREKLATGFTCLKMKIGAIDFEREYHILQKIRAQFSAKEIELRVDANGAFSPAEAPEKLERLALLDLHSIEQPIRAGQWTEMAQLCRNTPLPIALDEELIPVSQVEEKAQMLDAIQPQYIISKPSLLGGFKASEEWITLAEKRNIPWWATSALESNVGLNAIAQWTATFDNPLPQGLGTGQLYTNNIPSPLVVNQGNLHYDHQLQWDLSSILHDVQ